MCGYDYNSEREDEHNEAVQEQAAFESMADHFGQSFSPFDDDEEED